MSGHVFDLNSNPVFFCFAGPSHSPILSLAQRGLLNIGGVFGGQV